MVPGLRALSLSVALSACSDGTIDLLRGPPPMTAPPVAQEASPCGPAAPAPKPAPAAMDAAPAPMPGPVACEAGPCPPAMPAMPAMAPCPKGD